MNMFRDGCRLGMFIPNTQKLRTSIRPESPFVKRGALRRRYNNHRVAAGAIGPVKIGDIRLRGAIGNK